MAKPHLRLVTPGTKKRTVNLRRVPKSDLRTREYLLKATWTWKLKQNHAAHGT